MARSRERHGARIADGDRETRGDDGMGFGPMSAGDVFRDSRHAGVDTGT